MTIAAARTIARSFVRDVVRTGRQWDLYTLEGYLPRGMVLMSAEPADAMPATVEHLARFIARCAREA